MTQAPDRPFSDATAVQPLFAVTHLAARLMTYIWLKEMPPVSVTAPQLLPPPLMYLQGDTRGVQAGEVGRILDSQCRTVLASPSQGGPIRRDFKAIPRVVAVLPRAPESAARRRVQWGLAA